MTFPLAGNAPAISIRRMGSCPELTGESVEGPPRSRVSGSCAPGFERVRDAFEGNFTDRDEVGAAVAVWVEGDLVVNLWGGYADAGGPRPWRENTLASIFSGSKGLTSTCVHLLADRGELDLQAPVAGTGPSSARRASTTSPSRW